MSSFVIVPIEHNIKQAITAAIKAVEFKKYNVDPDEVVDNLLMDIFKTLFPSNPSLVSVERVEVQIPIVPAPAPEPEKKKRAPAKSKAKPAEEKPAEEKPAEEKPVEEKPAPKKRGPKPKVVNLAKLDAEQKKVLKKAGADAKAFLEHLNKLSSDEYSASTFDEHVTKFTAPPPEPHVVPEFVKQKFLTVEYPKGSGKEYHVDPKTQKVYRMTEGSDVHSEDYVGDVGLLEFADMELPEDNE